jgi:hypothetical protein
LAKRVIAKNPRGAASSHGLGIRRLRHRGAAGGLTRPSECIRGGTGRDPEGPRQTLVRFAYLVAVLTSLGVASSWLMVSPRVRPVSPRLRRPSSDDDAARTRRPGLPPGRSSVRSSLR